MVYGAGVVVAGSVGVFCEVGRPGVVVGISSGIVVSGAGVVVCGAGVVVVGTLTVGGLVGKSGKSQSQSNSISSQVQPYSAAHSSSYSRLSAHY